MFAEFNWWLLIVGLVVGAGLAWLVLADTRRREDEVEDRELAAEAIWLEDAMGQAGTPVDAATAEHLLRLHRAYLGVAPSDLDPSPAPAFMVSDELDGELRPLEPDETPLDDLDPREPSLPRD